MSALDNFKSNLASSLPGIRLDLSDQAIGVCTVFRACIRVWMTKDRYISDFVSGAVIGVWSSFCVFNGIRFLFVVYHFRKERNAMLAEKAKLNAGQVPFSAA